MKSILLGIFFLIIVFILIWMLKNDNKNIGQIFIRIILVIVITLIGAGITCGGNLYLDGIFPRDVGGYSSQFASELFVLWFLEIIAIFILSVRFLFFKTKSFTEIWSKIKNFFNTF